MIDIGIFKGEIPRISNKLLPDGYASSVINCDLDEGNLQPIKGTTSIQSVDVGAETIYRLGEQWLQWNNKIDIIESLVYNSGGRIVITGDNYPKETNIALAISGAPYPSATRKLGVGAPSGALTAAVQVAGSGTNRSIAYCYTRVGLWDDDTVVESAPSPASNILTTPDDGTIRLTGFVDSSETGVYTTHYRVYRVNTGETSSEYQYVGEFLKTTDPLQYDDEVTDDDLGEVLPTTGWTVPIDNLKGITKGSNGVAFAFDGNTVYVSESFIGYTFPTAYTISVASEIVGLGFNGYALIVLTKNSYHLIYGTDPESLSLETKTFELPCESRRSIVSVPAGIIFASSTGLYLIDSGGISTNITEGIFTKKDWKALGPSNIFAFFYNDSYVAFWDGTTRGIEFKPGINEIRRFQTDENVFGGQYVSTVGNNSYDLLTSASKNFLTAEGYQFVVSGASYSLTYDALYLIQKTATAREIVSWDSGSLTDYTYETKEYYTPVSQVFSAGLISGDFTDGNVVFRLYVDDTLIFTKTVSSDDIFRITQARGNKFKITLTGKTTIDRVIVGSSVREVIRKYND